MVKLIVSDVDGTLLPYGATTPSKSVIDAISSVLQKGVKFAIASGRSYEDLVNLFPELKDKVYFIAHDGALTVKDGVRLFHQAMPQETLRRVVNLYSNINGCIALYSMDKCYCIGKKNDFVKSNNVIQIKNLFEVRDQIYKIGIYGAQKHIKDDILGTRLCSLSEGCIEYVSSLAQKGTALSDLQMRLFMNKFDTAAVGNYYNDVKMLKNAKYSAAMASSPEDVKASAMYVTDNAEEFIVKCIEL